ncbi:MAG: hypothetical protein QXP04_05185 [Candidatus Nanoarchaeia archaeon]|nr:hypothetical protein [Candidatus Jingweiarchaeum tengchongense]
MTNKEWAILIRKNYDHLLEAMKESIRRSYLKLHDHAYHVVLSNEGTISLVKTKHGEDLPVSNTLEIYKFAGWNGELELNEIVAKYFAKEYDQYVEDNREDVDIGDWLFIIRGDLFNSWSQKYLNGVCDTAEEKLRGHLDDMISRLENN